MLNPKFKADDSTLNMTPMIDIVFQLILFFLFNLRFKSLDYRIETQLPSTEGIDKIFKIVDVTTIKASMFRLDAGTDHARTKVKVGSREWILPKEEAATRVERDGVLASIRGVLESVRQTSTAPGEIATPPPSGGFVPHADAVSLLDTFLSAGITEVKFGGAAMPRPLPR